MRIALRTKCIHNRPQQWSALTPLFHCSQVSAVSPIDWSKEPRPWWNDGFVIAESEAIETYVGIRAMLHQDFPDLTRCAAVPRHWYRFYWRSCYFFGQVKLRFVAAHPLQIPPCSQCSVKERLFMMSLCMKWRYSPFSADTGAPRNCLHFYWNWFAWQSLNTNSGLGQFGNLLRIRKASPRVISRLRANPKLQPISLFPLPITTHRISDPGCDPRFRIGFWTYNNACAPFKEKETCELPGQILAGRQKSFDPGAQLLQCPFPTWIQLPRRSIHPVIQWSFRQNRCEQQHITGHTKVGMSISGLGSPGLPSGYVQFQSFRQWVSIDHAVRLLVFCIPPEFRFFRFVKHQSGWIISSIFHRFNRFKRHLLHFGSRYNHNTAHSYSFKRT